jgi:YebC/PmpR family DNA-binding regulatory protein
MAGQSKWVRIHHRKGTHLGLVAHNRRSSADRTTTALESVRYEGYGPGGVALMVDCLTDNRHRTGADVRHTFAENGGVLGASGSVAYLFNQVGLLTYPPGTDDEELLAAALDAGAEDVVANRDGSLDVLTDPIDFETVRARLVADGFVPPDGEITQRAAVSVRLEGSAAEYMAHLLESLEELDDVQDVYSNAEIPDEVLARV